MTHLIHFRAVIEVLGKPKEHVEESIKSYINKLKSNKAYNVVSEEFAEIKKQEKEDMWSTFAEVEVKTEKIQDLVSFCFDFMPSMIEVLEPEKIILSDNELSLILNDLQAKLHEVDVIAKHVNMENRFLKSNTSNLMKNYITILLQKSSLTARQLGNLTGVQEEMLADFLDTLIDDGKIDLKGGTYFLKKKED